MTCQTCGRTGLCDTCCCVSNDHRGRLPNLTICRLCKHPLHVPRHPRTGPR